MDGRLGSGTTDYYCLLPAGFKGTIYVDMAGFRNLGGYTFDQIEAIAFEIRSAASAAAASEQNPQNLEIQLGNFRLNSEYAQGAYQNRGFQTSRQAYLC